MKKSGKCNNKLAGGFSDGIDGAHTFAYCGDIDGVIYLHSSANGGQYDNMDVDCDGAIVKNDDGRCDNSHSTQGVTAMKESVAALTDDVTDLNPFVHDYVVFGNSGDELGWVTFDPQEYGMEPLSMMAVVCGDKLVSCSDLI